MNLGMMPIEHFGSSGMHRYMVAQFVVKNCGRPNPLLGECEKHGGSLLVMGRLVTLLYEYMNKIGDGRLP